MTVRKITEYPANILAEIGKPVTKFDEDLGLLCSDMFETMYDAEGVGLAAPQIGLNLRLFVMDCEGVKLIAANPEIIARGQDSADQAVQSWTKSAGHAAWLYNPSVRTVGVGYSAGNGAPVWSAQFGR